MNEHYYIRLRQFRFFRGLLIRPSRQQIGFYVALSLSLICSVSSYEAAADHGGLHYITGVPYHLLQSCWVGSYNNPDASRPIHPSASAAMEAIIQFDAKKNLGKPCFGAPAGATRDYYVLGPPGLPTESWTVDYPHNVIWPMLYIGTRSPLPGQYDLGGEHTVIAGYRQSISYRTNTPHPPPYDHPYYNPCGGNNYFSAQIADWRTECLQNLHIKLAPLTGLPESSTTITSVEPGKDAALVAHVIDQNNQLVPNVGVKIEAEVIANTGGHKHHDSQRPKGKLNNQDPPTVTGSTGAGGFSFTFNAPAPAGDHTLKASCTGGKTCTQQGPDRVWVGVKDLVALYGAPFYVLTGSDAVHPDNHYLTNSALEQVIWLAQLYRGDFPNDPVLYLNDASLERGGMFDIQHPGRGTTWWTTPHKTHRFGVEIDIRANPQINPGTAIPAANFLAFEDLARELGATLCPKTGPSYVNTSNQHYHVCLMGGNCCQGGNR